MVTAGVLTANLRWKRRCGVMTTSSARACNWSGTSNFFRGAREAVAGAHTVQIELQGDVAECVDWKPTPAAKHGEPSANIGNARIQRRNFKLGTPLLWTFMSYDISDSRPAIGIRQPREPHWIQGSSTANLRKINPAEPIKERTVRGYTLRIWDSYHPACSPSQLLAF